MTEKNQDGIHITSMDELEEFIEEHLDGRGVGDTVEAPSIDYRVTVRVIDESGEEKDRQVLSNVDG